MTVAINSAQLVLDLDRLIADRNSLRYALDCIAEFLDEEQFWVGGYPAVPVLPLRAFLDRVS